MKTKLLGTLSLASICALGLAGPAVGQDDPDPQQAASDPNIRFFSGHASAQPGRFEGRLVCLRTDANFAVETATDCPDGSRVLALSMDDGTVVQPVLAGTEEIHGDLLENIDESVVIVGRHYQSIGMIFASAVDTPSDEAEPY